MRLYTVLVASELTQTAAEEVERAVERLQASIKAKHPDFKRILIEASALTHHQTQAGGPAAMPA